MEHSFQIIKGESMTIKELKEFLSKIPSDQEDNKVVLGLSYGWFPIYINQIELGIVD